MAKENKLAYDEVKRVPFEIKEIAEDGTFEGYASTFYGEPDSYGDLVDPGAFSKTIAEGYHNKNGVLPVLWQHDGDKPVGVFVEVLEDGKGLKVKGKIGINSDFGKYVLDQLKLGSISTMSIGYNVKVAEYNTETHIRNLKELELWEVSLVTFPANTNAIITDVKSAVEEATTEREIETALRDAGLSRTTAKFVASLCKEGLREGVSEELEPDVRSVLSKINAELKSLVNQK